MYVCPFLVLVAMYYLWKQKNRLNYNILFELLMAVILAVLFVDLAILSPFTNKSDLSPNDFLIIIMVNCFFLFFIYLIYASRNAKKQKLNIDKEPVKSCNYFFIFSLLVIYIIVRSFYIDIMFRWDGAWYFGQLIKSVDNFDFTIKSFIHGFNWYGHPAMGYAFIMSMGQFVDLGNHCIFNVQNLLLALLAIFSFYKIVLYLFGRDNNWEIVLLTTIFAFNPLFFGESISNSIDYPLLIFFTAAICALLYKRMISFALFATLLVFSKETGALLYLMLVIMVCLLSFICNPLRRKNAVAEKIIESRGSFLWFTLPGILFSGYLVLSRGKLWGGGSITWSNSGYHTFGYNWEVLSTRFLEMFVLNFNWMISFFIIMFLIKILLFRDKNKTNCLDKNRKDLLTVLLFVFLGFIGFNLFFITYVPPRYVLVSIFFLLILGYHSLINIIRNKSFRISILTVLLGLTIVQAFITIDPLSKAVFKTIQFGNHQILGINHADGMIYNVEYTVIDKLLNKFNKEININENSKIILSRDDWVTHFNGVEPHTAIYIDKNTLKRTFKTENTFQPEVFSVREITKQNRPAEAYYLFMSWYGDEEAELAYIQKYYKIMETRVIDHRGYFFKLYELKRL